jgi:hypothetical protein
VIDRSAGRGLSPDLFGLPEKWLLVPSSAVCVSVDPAMATVSISFEQAAH